jgi:hypothetical protein
MQVYTMHTVGILLVLALEGYQHFLLDTVLPANLYGLELPLSYPTLHCTPRGLHKLRDLVSRIEHPYGR